MTNLEKCGILTERYNFVKQLYAMNIEELALIISSNRGLQRLIAQEVVKEPMPFTKLIMNIRARNNEYKNTEVKFFAKTVAIMIKQGLMKYDG